MNKKSLSILIYCLATILIFAISLTALASCKRQYRSSKPAVVQPKQKDPAQLAADKISEYSNPDAVISVYELNKMTSDPNVSILDTRGRSFQVFAYSYPAGHVPGAIPILHAEYTHPAYNDRLAAPDQVQKTLGDKGINSQKKIVLYGNDGLQARIYWILKAYGCDNPVQILDGGYEKWKEAGFEAAVAAPIITPSNFAFNYAKADTNIYTNLEEVVDAILNYTPSTIIVDTRSKNEYLVGHIPTSVNISLLDTLNEDKTFKAIQELNVLMASKGVTPDKKVLVYSNNGVESSLVWFVLHELMGFSNVKNYDGGFSEWVERELVLEYGEQQLVVKPVK
ncbi:MAG: putative thiosulfate sulfurtransferase [Pelotomaculum sp. PtaB.Bin013]|uniref:Sulfurtransferase n=1 Tax=Pelotomaculum isophthalicicum JI TaxID=947010 RepID=A0A9X4H5R1_9FIRM|nr:rhodanese-like domain-containing protein [Pelotomaculum isophthalicicum]MDF9407844.1 hypothetical protein [Pelotomaculum isophthalicicum JI]OPX88312.1 MAG: putative thiosulfate sulfurtransferase [Pelotomaculum sp. PtaB.Bin013]